MRRLIIDCTHTFATGAGTGIQRVVRHMTQALLDANPEGFEVVPARFENGHVVPLPMAQGRIAFPRSFSARETVSSAKLSLLGRVTRPLVERMMMRSERFARRIDAGPNADGRGPRQRGPVPAGAIQCARGDVVLALDSSWVYDVRSPLDAAGAAGATRVAMICDVLPLTQPAWFTEGTRRYFGTWLRAILPRLEGILTISDATQDDIRRLHAAGALGTSPLPPMQTVHLGAEIHEPAAQPIRQQLRAAFDPAAGPAFLCVGTLEPRKNVDYALDLFDALLARGWRVRWHIAGAPGWLAHKTARRIQSHPQYGYGLFWWTDLNDAELAACYRHAAALVAVSRAEGFGLPLVEARLHGLTVFASDIPVFREVLGAEGTYLPLDAPTLAASILEDFLGGRVPGPPRSQPSLVARTWAQSAADLLQAVGRMEDPHAGRSMPRNAARGQMA